MLKEAGMLKKRIAILFFIGVFARIYSTIQYNKREKCKNVTTGNG